MDEKKIFEEPKLEIVMVDDIITASGYTDYGNLTDAFNDDGFGDF